MLACHLLMPGLPRGEGSDQSYLLPVRAFESPFASLTLLLLPLPSGESRAQTVILLSRRTWDLGSEQRYSLLQATQLVRDPASDLGLWTQHVLPSKGRGMGQKEGGRRQKEGKGWL